MASTPHPLFITLPYKQERAAPDFTSNDDKYPETLVRHFIKHYSKKSDKIFDPFAGLGTTLFEAEKLGRDPYGIEADRDRYEWVAAQMENWTAMRHDDAFKMDKHDFPKFDLVLTSPPFMATSHKWNPLYDGDPKYAGYDVYLKRMTAIFKKLPPLMKKGATLIVHVDNLLIGHRYTPLVRDMADAVSKSFDLKSEIIVAWDNPPAADYKHTHCLVFKKA